MQTLIYFKSWWNSFKDIWLKTTGLFAEVVIKFTRQGIMADWAFGMMMSDFEVLTGVSPSSLFRVFMILTRLSTCSGSVSQKVSCKELTNDTFGMAIGVLLFICTISCITLYPISGHSMGSVVTNIVTVICCSVSLKFNLKSIST